MIFLDELNNLTLYKKQFYLPIIEKDKRLGSSILLLTPNYESSKKLMNSSMIINKWFSSYYIEKDITYFINQEGNINLDDIPYNVLNENLRYIVIESSKDKIWVCQQCGTPRDEKKEPHCKCGHDHTISLEEYNKSKSINESYHIGRIDNDYESNNNYIRCRVENNDIMLLFNENLDHEVMQEADIENNTIFHKLLYNERYKNNKEVWDIYDKVKQDNSFIKYTYLDYDKYKKFNLFIDLSFYNQTFFKNNIYKLDKGIELYFDFIDRFINDKRIEKAGYSKKTVFIPISDWDKPDTRTYNFSKDINPISTIYRLMKINLIKLQEAWKDIDFVFIGDNGYFKLDFNLFKKEDIPTFMTLINKLEDSEFIPKDIDPGVESKKAIVANIVDKIEIGQNIKINSLTGDSKDINKDELVQKIEKAASTSSTTDETLDKLDEDDHIKSIIDDIASEEDDSVKINAARQSRMLKAQNEFLNKKIKNTSIREMIEFKDDKKMPVTSLNIDSVNDDWKNLTYVNFEDHYNIQADILKMLNSFSNKSVPVVIRDIEIVDSSTSEDYKETYIVKMEDYDGKRFTLKFDVPKMVDNKFMLLRGNEKTINGQEMLLPITKTDEDTVQIVSNYNKIFIRRFGTSTGKSYPIASRILKTLGKDTFNFNAIPGDNSRVCSKYELPIDYIDLSSELSKIEGKDFIIYFNQDEIRNKYNDIIDIKKGIPLIYEKNSKSIIYWDGNGTVSAVIQNRLLLADSKFSEVYDTTNVGSRYTYSKASILNTEIPVIVIMAYNEGLTTSMKKGNIKYEISEKRRTINKDTEDIIRFNDGYIIYQLDYNSSLLMNGLKECNTEDYSLKEINKKNMYLNFLDLFGGRLKADGLDNFYDLMIDDITKEVLEYYKLPEDYIELYAYANLLLADNKYIKHTSMEGKRYRSNELIAGYVYTALAKSYSDYRNSLKKNRKGATMTIKQTEILDRILADPTASDSSTLNALLDLEQINAVSPKGLSGMNSDRSYNLEKRTYDESMLGILGLSTGFAGNVGITRQTVMDMNIEGRRGYFKINSDPKSLSVSKAFCATEAVTPFGTTRDDPFRSAMTFIQTAKHGMRVKRSMPMLISNGADQALPYMISNKFAFKAKQDGRVLQKTDDYVIIQYKDGTNDFVDLREVVKKNSDGGFYVTLKLDCDLKQGSSVKKNQIVAYDKMSFSNEVGHTNDLAYMNSTLCKIAIMNTDEGYEDSGIISEWLSDALSSEVVVMKDITLPKNTNIYNMVKKGQPIQEGDPLIIFQNAFEDEDINMLLKNLVDDEDAISDLGRIPVKSKITGVVEDVRVYRTVEKEELSNSLKKKVNEIEKPLTDLTKIMEKHNIEYAQRYNTGKLEPTGKLKHARDSVLIEFYLKYNDKMSIGDKLIYYSALKGVVKDIFPIDKEPYTDFRPNEKIHSLLSLGSVNGRMVCSVLVVGAINKVLIELDRKVKEIAGIKWKNIDEF